MHAKRTLATKVTLLNRIKENGMKIGIIIIMLTVLVFQLTSCSDDDASPAASSSSVASSSSSTSSSTVSSSSSAAALPVEPCSSDAIRIATFNIQNLTSSSLLQTNHSSVLKAAAIIKLVRPDILVLNEIDHDYANISKGLDHTARLLATNYLLTGTNALVYPYSYLQIAIPGSLQE
jgi:3-polyprenyl-4-hydroxybenzoate decarboxylase